MRGSSEAMSTNRSDEAWRWWFLENPCGQATIFVLETEGTIVGHQSHVPGEMWVDGRRLQVGIGGDSWVKRGFQGPGGMRRIVEAFLASDHGLDVRINYPGERSAQVFERLGLGTVVGEASIWARAHNRSFFARQSSPAVLPLSLTARAASAVASAGPDGSISSRYATSVPRSTTSRRTRRSSHVASGSATPSTSGGGGPSNPAGRGRSALLVGGTAPSAAGSSSARSPGRHVD